MAGSADKRHTRSSCPTAEIMTRAPAWAAGDAETRDVLRFGRRVGHADSALLDLADGYQLVPCLGTMPVFSGSRLDGTVATPNIQ